MISELTANITPSRSVFIWDFLIFLSILPSPSPLEMKTLFSAGSRSAMFAAEAMRIEFAKEFQFSLFLENWKMNSLNFNFHRFRKFEKRNRKIFIFMFLKEWKMNFEKWVVKLFSIFNRNEKWKWPNIFIFHFSSSKKKKLALGYTHWQTFCAVKQHIEQKTPTPTK